ncbi:MAG: glycosyltransferase family 4 protein [Brumimicrobium sp.]
MPKILFIAPYPFGEAPSQRFRFEQYKTILEEEHDVEYSPFYSLKIWEILYQKGKNTQKTFLLLSAYCRRFILLFKLRKYDYIFVHREIAPMGPPIFEFLLAKICKRKYIYDFDDAIWLPNYSKANSKFQFLKSYWKVKYIIKWADKVTVGNEYLANYARQFNKNVEVIPTTIDTENYHTVLTDHTQEKVVIGWTGSHSTMKYLDFFYPIIAELEQKYDFTFRIISDKNPEVKLKSLEFVKWNKATEIEDLSKIHIGVMPLVDNQWARGKCGFKGLQYMALEVVSVMSPVGVNQTIVQNGKNGFLANTPEEWKDILIDLLKDAEKRKEIGKNGRIRVIEAYSVLSQKEKYLRLFKA